jgi:hypothetical protein
LNQSTSRNSTKEKEKKTSFDSFSSTSSSSYGVDADNLSFSNTEKVWGGNEMFVATVVNVKDRESSNRHRVPNSSNAV